MFDIFITLLDEEIKVTEPSWTINKPVCNIEHVWVEFSLILIVNIVTISFPSVPVEGDKIDKTSFFANDCTKENTVPTIIACFAGYINGIIDGKAYKVVILRIFYFSAP